MGITVEELRDYCMQLCEEGKGGGCVSVAMCGVGVANTDVYNTDLDWQEVTDVAYDGGLHVLATDCIMVDKKYIRALAEDVDKALDRLSCGSVEELKKNIVGVQECIDILMIYLLRR